MTPMRFHTAKNDRTTSLECDIRRKNENKILFTFLCHTKILIKSGSDVTLQQRLSLVSDHEGRSKTVAWAKLRNTYGIV